jgi:phage repressor protein C with HTH and peptisase S24 domain
MASLRSDLDRAQTELATFSEQRQAHAAQASEIEALKRETAELKRTIVEVQARKRDMASRYVLEEADEEETQIVGEISRLVEGQYGCEIARVAGLTRVVSGITGRSTQGGTSEGDEAGLSVRR